MPAVSVPGQSELCQGRASCARAVRVLGGEIQCCTEKFRVLREGIHGLGRSLERLEKFRALGGEIQGVGRSTECWEGEFRVLGEVQSVGRRSSGCWEEFRALGEVQDVGRRISEHWEERGAEDVELGGKSQNSRAVGLGGPSGDDPEPKLIQSRVHSGVSQQGFDVC